MKGILLVKGQDDLESTRVVRQKDGSLEMVLHGTALLEPALAPFEVAGTVVLGIPGHKSFSFNEPSVVVNLICDADANQKALLEAVSLDTQMSKPIINRPADVQRTTRESIARMAAGIVGLMAPPVTVVRPRRLQEIADLWQSGAVSPAFIIRPLSGHTHGGKKLLRVTSADDLGALEQYAFDGGAFGVSPFIDYRSADGLYRKYRLFFVDGKAYPRHMIAGPEWMIHSEDRLAVMKDRPDLQVEEQRFLANPAGVLGKKAWAAVHELVRRTKLDYIGMDFGLLPDGRVVLFECNAAMNVLGQGAGGSFPYLAPVAEQIKTALTQMVARRLNKVAEPKSE